MTTDPGRHIIVVKEPSNLPDGTDPRSGREYFHGPGGESSWVLPTTTIRPDNTIQRSAMDDGEAPNNGDDVKGRSKPVDATRHLKQWRIWSSVWIAIIIIVTFNTLFLLVLVKFIINVNVGQEHASSAGGVHIEAHENIVSIRDLSNVGAKEFVEVGPVHVFDGSTLPSKANPGPENGSHRNKKIREMTAAADDPFIPTTSPGAPPVNSFSPVDAIGAEATSNGEREQISSIDVLNSKQPADEEDEHQQELNEMAAGYINKKAINVRETDVPPMKCWIPFSYIIVGKCRQHALKGLAMPLADAESLLLI
jgi:hypothetical protein